MAAGLKSTYLTPPFLIHINSLNKMDALAVILLSFVLAVGFLMIILSCALWSNWLPLFVGSFIVFLYLSPPLDLSANMEYGTMRGQH